jgi:histidine triad (HIT) family protein
MKNPDCIFCRIAAGEIPAPKIIDDQWAVAFMDISPLVRGHVLLIPKGHAITVDELSREQAAGLLGHLPSLVKAVKAVTGCQGVNVLQNNGIVAHQLVMHVHFHIIPRNPGDEFHFNWPAGKIAPAQAQHLAEQIKAKL